MKTSLGKSIRFERGVPELSEDLCEINARYNNIIILNDLMAEATDSSVVSRLFTQGRHRNASAILLLQNMFPKGKYNTDNSRNAQYLALFRSPSDRKQFGIIAERMFDKNRVHFMNAYYKETEKPFGYLLVDNKPGTPPNNQILADLFGKCYAYHFGVNSTEPKRVETKPVGKHSTTTKTIFQGRSLCKPSPGPMQLFPSGKNTPRKHRRSVRFPKDMLSSKCTTHRVIEVISLSVEVLRSMAKIIGL